jgi:hypothetical protein
MANTRKVTEIQHAHGAVRLLVVGADEFARAVEAVRAARHRVEPGAHRLASVRPWQA